MRGFELARDRAGGEGTQEQREAMRARTCFLWWCCCVTAIVTLRPCDARDVGNEQLAEALEGCDPCAHPRRRPQKARHDPAGPVRQSTRASSEGVVEATPPSTAQRYTQAHCHRHTATGTSTSQKMRACSCGLHCSSRLSRILVRTGTEPLRRCAVASSASGASAVQAVIGMISNPVNSTCRLAAGVLKKAWHLRPQEAHGKSPTLDVVPARDLGLR